MNRWNGKVAIVTGASSGIGKAIATKLVENGMIVAGLARRKGLVDELAAKLKGAKGELHGVQVNMTNEEEILKAFEYVAKNLGPVHVLVNSAGISRVSPLTCGRTDQWKDVLETNVIGLSIATREAVKSMSVNNVDGHIIHINSVVGHSFRKTSSAMYGASKFAVTALTDALRDELNQAKSKIKITSISPGFVDTEILDRVSEHSDGLFPMEYVHHFKLNPSLKAEDVADCALYVLSTPPHVQVHDIILRPVGETAI
uniref:Dehydrogenase/reductase SDR family member 11 n=1 Tax=Photinus pyralis TaxID=7054 RepID=A0A1Y1MUK6_PHOPY